MQKIYLDNFIKDIENIREYIKHIDLVNRIEKENKGRLTNDSIKEFVEHFRSFRTEKRRFEHRAVIISLYGILENHINVWVQEHINNIPLILKDRSLLSPKILESNFNLSIELISILLKQIGHSTSSYSGIKLDALAINSSLCKSFSYLELIVLNFNNVSHEIIYLDCSISNSF